jgi:hypothetical protein
MKTNKTRKKGREKKKKRSSNTYKTIYKQHNFKGYYPVIHPLKYRALNLVDKNNKITDFPKRTPLYKFVRGEYIRRLENILRSNKKAKYIFKKKMKKQYTNKIKLQKYSDKNIQTIYLSILDHFNN